MNCCEAHASELRCDDCPWCRIAQLEAENTRIKAANDEADKILADGVRELQAENAKLREGMADWYAHGWKNGKYIDSIADYFEELLKEKGDE